MKWLELSVETPHEFVEPLSQIFYRYGHGGVAVEEKSNFSPYEGETEGETQPIKDLVILKTYLPLDSTAQERRNRIDIGVSLVAHVGPVSALREKVIEDKEWENAWKEHFHVLHIGKRTIIRPTWRQHNPSESEIVVALDPGMAFGTGHHPTTRMCLELLEATILPGMDVLDVGCGSGILSIAAAKLGAKSVLGIEIDSVAVRVAKQNVRDNGVGFLVQITNGSLPHSDVRASSYDIAVANISAKVVSDTAGELVRTVRTGGRIIASGILTEKKDAIVEALTLAGGLLEQTVVDGDWVTLVASVP